MQVAFSARCIFVICRLSIHSYGTGHLTFANLRLRVHLFRLSHMSPVLGLACVRSEGEALVHENGPRPRALLARKSPTVVKTPRAFAVRCFPRSSKMSRPSFFTPAGKTMNKSGVDDKR